MSLVFFWLLSVLLYLDSYSVNISYHAPPRGLVANTTFLYGQDLRVSPPPIDVEKLRLGTFLGLSSVAFRELPGRADFGVY